MNAIKEYIKLYENDAILIRREIHKNPELSMEENDTTRLVKDKLEEYGLEIVPLSTKTGVAAVLEGAVPGKTIMFRADMDALPMEEHSDLPFSSQNPGVCHSCGHDIHTSTLLLTARVLSKMRNELAGRILFIFQPAEEKFGGAEQMIKAGLLKTYQPDFAVGIHCWPEIPGGTIGIRRGPFMAAADRVTLKVKGRGGHGAHPHKSVDPIMTAGYILTQMQSIVSRSVAPIESAVLTMGKIVGGTTANVIPDEVIMEGTVRTFAVDVRDTVEKRIRTVAECGAAAMGASCEIEYDRGHSAVVCDPAVVDLIEDAANKVIGSENVVHLETPSMGSEDFADYLEIIPGAMFRIGTMNEDPKTQRPLHNSGIIFDERSIAAGASVLCQTAMEYLNVNS